MGLLPVLVWPYWPPNLVYSVAVELLLRRRAVQTKRDQLTHRV